METAEQKIRDAVGAIPNLTIGSWNAITVEHNGVTQNFLANIKRVVSNGRDKPAIHLIHIRFGKLLASMPSQYIANYLKLDKNNNLKFVGLPATPTELTLKKWNNSFA